MKMIFLPFIMCSYLKYKGNWINFAKPIGIIGLEVNSPYQLRMAHLDSDNNAQNGTVDSFSIDWNGPIVAEVQEEHIVTVPNTSCLLNEESLEQLKTLVNPLVDCDDHGTILYIAAKEFVEGIN